MVVRSLVGMAPGRVRAVPGATAALGVAVTITTQLDAGRVIQRTTSSGGGQGKGQASVPMALSFTGTQPVYCRRRSASDNVTIVQGPWLANASATTGTITLSGIDVPAINAAATAPVAANDGWFYLDVATSSSGPWTNGTSSVTAGRLTMISGQSLAVRMVGRQDGQTNTNMTLSVTITPYASLLYTYNETRAYLPTVSTMPWAFPADGGNYDSTFCSEFTRRQVQLFGCPAGIIGHSRGAQPLSTFASGGAEATTWLAPVISKAGGAFESCIWYQGHTEAGYGVPPGGYSQAMTQLFTYFATLSSRAFTKYVGSVPNIKSASWGTPWCRHWIRRGHEVWANANSAQHVAVNDIDLVADNIHNSQVGSVTLAQHFARSTKVELSLRGDAGPALVSATRSGTVITAVFSDVGQGNLVLTGTPGNRIFVFPTGTVDTQGTSNNRFPVSTVTVTNKTTLSITLANDPGDGNTLDMWLYWPNDNTTFTADNIRDDITDGDGIAVGRQVVPNNVALTIAPTGSGVNAPPGGLVAATSQFTMTETSTTYGAQEQTGFNGTLNGGTAITAGSQNFKWPLFLPYSIHVWFTAPSVAPAGTQVIVGGTPTFLAITTAMKIQFAGSSSTVMTAGHRYHICCTQTATGHAIYMTDITASGSGTRVYSDSSASSTLPAAANLAMRNLNGGNTLVAANATQDEVAIFDYEYYTGTTYTAPSAPFTGLEPGIVALYHLDTNCADVVCA